jgi:N-acetylmuramoyl-L-alanine amidase
MKKIKKVTVHGGHNPAGKVACGAVGILDESKEDRIITKKVIALLKKNGITAVNCTVDNGTGQTDVLKKICAKCNAQADVDLNISIHFNSGAGDKTGNGKTTGTEVLLTANESDKGDVAKRICNQMEKLGFTNRGVKVNKNLYVLNQTKAPAILVETCFVDDKDDAKLYNKDKDAVAEAIVKGILNHNKNC